MEGGSETLPMFEAQTSHEAKLTELLRNLTSVEVKLCSDACKDFIKLLRGDSGAELLREYVRTSSSCSELLQAWKLRQGNPGLSNVLSLISAILCHPDGMCKGNDSGGSGVSRAIDKFARLILVEKLEDVYKELNSKDAKRQNAALFLLASVVRRGPSFASDVAKSFDFKLPVFPKLAEYKQKKLPAKRKHSTRRTFVGFAMSFLEVGKPGLLRWVLQQREMYTGVLRGLGNDDDETVVYILSTLRDRILIPESLIPPGLRSVLFGSVTLDQLISISGRDSDGHAAELAHSVLVSVCTDPSNGLMPDLKRQPNPLRGNPKRLLGLMKKLKATDIDYHRDLLVAIVKENPSFGSLYMDVFPYNLEDYTSPTWFAAISLAANLISEVGSGLPLGFLDSHPDDPPHVNHPDWQSFIKCLCPRPFSRVVANKGLLHTNFLVKHGILRLVLEALKLLDTFISRVETYYCSRNQILDSCAPLKEEIQNEVRTSLPDPQVLLSLLSSLNTHYKSLESCLKRKEGSQIILDRSVNSVKKLKIDSRNDDEDILVSGVYPLPDTALPNDNGGIQDICDVEELNNIDDHRKGIADIWGVDESSMCNMKLQDEETFFYSKLLDTLKIYHRVMPAALEGSFDFFKILPGNPLVLPTILQQSLLSLLIEVIGWSSKGEFPFRTPALMFKHLQQFINLLLCSPFKDIKGQAHILAEAAMLSTGAFDNNPREIGVWFWFLPGYRTGKSSVGEEGVEVLKNLFSVTVTFLCDAVSTTGNNLFKYWDLLRHHTYHLKGIEDVSPNFSPLVICVLEKCLRVLTSESGTFTLPEKSMISLYVCNSVKSLLQTQVEAGLLSSLVDLLISRRIQERCSLVDNNQDLCEWRPLKNLLLFTRSIINQRTFMFSSIERKAHADSSFINVLGEAKRVLRSETDCGLARVAKAFMHSVISVHPAVILQNFPLVISISCNLFGVPLSLLLSMLFLEPSLLYDVFKFWPEIFSDGLEKSLAMINGGERKEEILVDMDSDLIGCASVAFGFFLKQASFYVLFPAIVSADEPFLLEGSKLQDLLWAKLSELEIGNYISSVRLVLFWFHKIQLSYRMKPVAKFEQLSGECCSLIQWMLVRLLGEQPDSGQVIIRNIVEVIEVVLCHPVVILSLEDPLNDQEEVTEGIFGDSLENFLGFARQGINKMDGDVLNVLTVIFDHLVTFYSWRSLVEVEYVNEKLSKAFRGLAKKLNLIFRCQFDECLKSENLKPLNRTLYILHTFIRFISPIELLELVHWMLSRINLSDSALRVTERYSLSVGLWIAGCAFDMLSAYFLQPCTGGIPYSVFWGLDEKSFDVLLFENIYFEVIKIALHFELDCADLCLVKAVNLANKSKVVQRQCLALSVDILRVILNTPMKVLAHCMNKISMTRANILYRLTEVSPFHLSVFGRLFSDMKKQYLLLNGTVIEGTPDNAVSEDHFVMLLPTALTYLNSTGMKCRVQFRKCAIDISSFYCRILLQSFSDWKNYVSRDIFNAECTELLATSSEEILCLVSGSLLGKAILMLRYCFALNGNAVNLKKRLRLFDSVCPHAHDNILDCDVNEVDAYSPNKALNLVNRVVAKTYFCSMLLFPKDDLVQPLPKDDGNMKEILSGKRSNKVDLSRIRFMNILVNTWQLFVKKFPLNSSDLGKVGSSYGLFRFLEAFILRNILELTREMHKCLVKLNCLPFIERLGRSCLLHRFEDSETLKMLRDVLGPLSDRNCYILVLQLVLTHSQFVPTICYVSKSSGVSQIGVVFRPIASILSLLVIPSTEQSAINGQHSQQKTSELYTKKLEVVKLLRTLFHHKAWQCGFDFEKDIGISSRELLFLLLSSYGATLSEVDLEIYNLMLEIESVNGDTGILSEMDYLWGIAAVKVRKERELEQHVSSDKINDVEAVGERRRNQFRENLLVDPKICATTVLHFPYDITVSERTSSLFEIQHGSSEDMVETCYASIEEKHIYDPVFILHFSIHSLLMGYVEPVEFASLGLLAIAFVSISSVDDEIRKLGYEALGRFKAALEKCQKRKDIIRLRLLLTYLQNGIEQPWQRIPSLITIFAAEASFILLDPSHNLFSTISRFLVRSPRVNMKCIPLFQDLFWSSSDTFRTDRMWILRLLHAGINSDNDAQVYIGNDILEILLAFYASPLSDNESKGLILQVVKKSVKLNGMAFYLVEHCSLISWLSSIVSVLFGRQYQAQRYSLLITVMEVVTEVISSQNTIEWLQKFALEQLSELSTQLYRLLFHGNLIKYEAHLFATVLPILTSTLKISQKREVYQPHFTLSIEDLLQIYYIVNECNHGNFSPTADLGLRVILMSSPPAAIFHVDQEKLLKFVHWAISTALQSNSEEVIQSRNAYCHSRILLEEDKSEDSLISKLLRWLTASMILGKLSWRTGALDSKSAIERINLDTLASLIEHNVNRCGENHSGFGCEAMLAAAIFHLQLLLGLDYRLLASVVTALSLLLFYDLSHLEEMECLPDDGNNLALLWSRIRCPVEANPAWRWSFYQPWNDLSSNPTDAEKLEEIHACQSLLLIISSVIAKKSSPHSNILSYHDLENCGVFNWERSILDIE